MLKYSILVLGFAGIILFFPFNFGNGHSCLAHKYFKSSTAGCCDSYTQNDSSEAGMKMVTMPSHHNHLLKHYLYPFAFLWWTSIGLVFLQLRNLNLKKKSYSLTKRYSK
jgi:hypothetical protein